MENRHVIRFAFAVGGFTMLSRVLGMVRDVLTAGVFGHLAGDVVVRRGVPHSEPVPRAVRRRRAVVGLRAVFMDSRRNEGEAAAWRLARRVATLVGVVLLGIVALGIAGMSVALGGAELGEKAAAVLRWRGSCCPTSSSSAWLRWRWPCSILPAVRRVRVHAGPAEHHVDPLRLVHRAARPRRRGRQIRTLAWTVFAAGAVQLAYQVPALLRVGWRPASMRIGAIRALKQVFLLMGPSALGLAVNQVNVMVNSMIALWVGAWAPSRCSTPNA
jgi:putative peptidoglycan lipid II flippase